MQDKAKRIKELEEIITKERHNYYNKSPEISDLVFDAYIDELTDLDPLNQKLINIGAESVSNWEKYKHKQNVGSLNKCNTFDQFEKWAKDYANNNDFFVTLKLDGLSISLVYEDGKLTVAATRGQNEIGENILQNVVKMQNVPLRLKNKTNATIRGEIVLSKENYKKYFSEYSNCRNAAAGISRRYDGSGCEHLQVLVYELICDTDFTTEQQQFNELKNLGFSTPDYYLFKTTKQVFDFKENFQKKIRNTLSIDLDGLVVRNNDLLKQKKFGLINGRPRGAIAVKFSHEARETKLIDVIWSVGNSGRIVPEAIFEQVNIGGANIKQASLHNSSILEELKLFKDCRIIVSRRNDVIPYVEENVDFDIDNKNYFKQIDKCPKCLTKAQTNGEFIVCPNYNCVSQVVGRIKNWVKELNILELGDVLIEKLVENNLIKTIPDLYKLTIEDLSSLDRMGKKSAQNVYNSIWKTNKITLEKFLGALSIPNVGVLTIKVLKNSGYNTLEKILNMSENDMLKINGFGPIKARSLFNGLKEKKELINKIIENGVVIQEKEQKAGNLNDLIFAFTGTMVNKRNVLEKMVLDNGGQISSVNKNLSYLVIADVNSTSSKALAAKKLGVELISEEQFLELCKLC